MDSRNVVDLVEATERLEAVAEALEEATERMAEARLTGEGAEQHHVRRIVATVDPPYEARACAGDFVASSKEVELERRLAEAEARIAELSANAHMQAEHGPSRKTLPAGMTLMLAKQGVALDLGAAGVPVESGAIDGALASLSIEQRIAVKAEMRRAGLLS